MDLQKSLLHSVFPTQFVWIKTIWKEQDTSELHLYPRQWYIVKKGGTQKGDTGISKGRWT